MKSENPTFLRAEGVAIQKTISAVVIRIITDGGYIAICTNLIHNRG